MRYFLSVIAVVVILIISIAVIARSGNHTKKQPTNVASYNQPASSVTQTTYGLLVGEQQRTAVEVSVNSSTRNIYILNGYENSVVTSQSFANTPAAFGVFLGALQDAGYASGKSTSEQNMFGVCPEGDTFTYVLNNGTKNVSSLWSDSCDTNDGTLRGTASLIQELFSQQIPDYNIFTQKLQNISLND